MPHRKEAAGLAPLSGRKPEWGWGVHSQPWFYNPDRLLLLVLLVAPPSLSLAVPGLRL